MDNNFEQKAELSALIERAKHGDKKAFSDIIKQYYGLVIHYLIGHNIKYSDAEDIAQEAFINLFNKIDKVNNVNTFSAWLLKIAHNLLIDKIRKEKKLDISGNEYELEGLVNDKTPELEILADNEVNDIFAGLKSRDRVILELRVFQNMPFAEIAELNGMTEGNVRLVFHRIITKLRAKCSTEQSN